MARISSSSPIEFGEPFELVADLVAAERGQAVQAKLEDRLHLRFGELVGLRLALRLDRFDQRDVGADLGARPLAGEQLLARFRRAGRPADQLHHLVEIGDRDDEAEQDVGALAGLQQLELRAAGDDLFADT